MTLSLVFQDGRLKVNDQLLEVNDEVLIGLANSEAMENLRTAMQKDSAKPGHIHIVVGRRPSPAVSLYPSSSEGKEVRVSQSEDPRDIWAQDDNTETQLGGKMKAVEPSVIQQPKPLSPQAMDRPVTLGDMNKVRNPVLDRLTGNNLANNIRNESYVRATHDSLNESTDSANSDKIGSTTHFGQLPNNNGMTISSPSSHRGETVLIEGDNYQVQMVPRFFSQFFSVLLA